MKPILRINNEDLKNVVEESKNIVQDEQLTILRENVRGLYRLRANLEAKAIDLEKSTTKTLADLKQRMSMIDNVLDEVSKGNADALQKIKLNPDFMSELSTRQELSSWLASLKIETEKKD